MKAGLCALALGVTSVAWAHPIEPLITGSPMPVPRDYVGVDTAYSLLREHGHNEQRVPLSLTAGIGGMAELSVGGVIDATEGTVGPALLGGKLLLVMEGRRGVDVAVAGRFSSDHAVEGQLLVGRSIRPGFYLQASAAYEYASAPAAETTTGTQTAALTLAPHHSGDVTVSGQTQSTLRTAAALQWAVRPRLLPTLEVQWMRNISIAEDEVWIAPELIALLEINHLAVKAAVPVGLAGGTDIGLLTSLVWQR